jgi:hypothetical protein
MELYYHPVKNLSTLFLNFSIIVHERHYKLLCVVLLQTGIFQNFNEIRMKMHNEYAILTINLGKVEAAGR